LRPDFEHGIDRCPTDRVQDAAPSRRRSLVVIHLLAILSLRNFLFDFAILHVLLIPNTIFAIVILPLSIKLILDDWRLLRSRRLGGKWSNLRNS
jgi:hypothetical protein